MLPLLAIGFGVGHVAGYNSGRNAVPQQCEAPITLDNSAREEFLLGEATTWQKRFESMEYQWLQCTRDLARVSEELNHETICSEGVCEAR